MKDVFLIVCRTLTFTWVIFRFLHLGLKCLFTSNNDRRRDSIVKDIYKLLQDKKTKKNVNTNRVGSQDTLYGKMLDFFPQRCFKRK